MNKQSAMTSRVFSRDLVSYVKTLEAAQLGVEARAVEQKSVPSEVRIAIALIDAGMEDAAIVDQVSALKTSKVNRSIYLAYREALEEYVRVVQDRASSYFSKHSANDQFFSQRWTDAVTLGHAFAGSNTAWSSFVDAIPPNSPISLLKSVGDAITHELSMRESGSVVKHDTDHDVPKISGMSSERLAKLAAQLENAIKASSQEEDEKKTLCVTGHSDTRMLEAFVACTVDCEKNVKACRTSLDKFEGTITGKGGDSVSPRQMVQNLVEAQLKGLLDSVRHDVLLKDVLGAEKKRVKSKLAELTKDIPKVEKRLDQMKKQIMRVQQNTYMAAWYKDAANEIGKVSRAIARQIQVMENTKSLSNLAQTCGAMLEVSEQDEADLRKEVESRQKVEELDKEDKEECIKLYGLVRTHYVALDVLDYMASLLDALSSSADKSIAIECIKDVLKCIPSDGLGDATLTHCTELRKIERSWRTALVDHLRPILACSDLDEKLGEYVQAMQTLRYEHAEDARRTIERNKDAEGVTADPMVIDFSKVDADLTAFELDARPFADLIRSKAGPLLVKVEPLDMNMTSKSGKVLLFRKALGAAQGILSNSSKVRFSTLLEGTNGLDTLQAVFA